MLQTERPWKRALLWLLVLGPGFFLLYGSVNHFTATREPVASLYLGIEHSIPVVQWHILPYMLLDLMFAASLFMCRTKLELDQHARRLAAAILICCACFLLWPLKFGFERPIMEGFWGLLHGKLTEFDLPYNQAPSLHVVLACLVGFIFNKRGWRWLKWPNLIWCGIIVISVLTTHQHHAIDILVAIPVLLFCFCLFPDHQISTKPFEKIRAHDLSHWVGKLYLAITGFLFAIGSLLGYWGMLLIIPALATALMAAVYIWKDERLLLKNSDGTTHWLIKFVLFPVTWVQLVYKRWYTSKVNTIDLITSGIYISRRLNNNECSEQIRINKIAALIDVAPEFAAPTLPENVHYEAFNWLDLAPVRCYQLNIAADVLKQHLEKGNVLIECKLGLQRSVLVVLAYLVKHKSLSVGDAFALVKNARHGAVLRKQQIEALEELSC